MKNCIFQRLVTFYRFCDVFCKFKIKFCMELKNFADEFDMKSEIDRWNLDFIILNFTKYLIYQQSRHIFLVFNLLSSTESL